MGRQIIRFISSFVDSVVWGFVSFLVWTVATPMYWVCCPDEHPPESD